MTEELPKLRELLAVATPGEWIFARDVVGNGYRIVRQKSERQPLVSVGMRHVDAALIVELRNASPALLDLAEYGQLWLETADSRQRLVERAQIAEADNTALRTHLAGGQWRSGGGFARRCCGFILDRHEIEDESLHVKDCILAQPHPGAALLERIAKLEAVAEAALHLCVDDDCCDKTRRLTAAIAALARSRGHYAGNRQAPETKGERDD